MSRGRRLVRVKPVIVDGFKFASQGEAQRYQGLKTLAGVPFTATPSTDGRVVVCEWGGTHGAPRQTQAFSLVAAGKNKYNARKVTLNNITYDSGREASRHTELLRLVAAGEVDHLVYHPPAYELIVGSVRIGRYTPDFTYRIVATNKWIVEDSKSAATRKARDYPLRKKLMLACHGIAIAEV